MTGILIIFDLILLVYISVLVLVSVILVWKKYHIHTPPSIQSTRWLWISHGVVSIVSLIYILLVCISSVVPAIAIVSTLYTPFFVISAQACTLLAINHSAPCPKHPMKATTLLRLSTNQSKEACISCHAGPPDDMIATDITLSESEPLLTSDQPFS